MIYLSRLDGSSFVLNADRIETIEAHPDTVITSVDGKHFVVKEHVDAVVAQVVDYQRTIRQGGFRIARPASEGAIDG
ncbi:MAG: flagellar FlbD family protein [Chloroflexota bacterium]